MNKYNILEQLGDGSFGSVLKAQNLENGTMVSGFDLVCYQKDEEKVSFME